MLPARIYQYITCGAALALCLMGLAARADTTGGDTRTASNGSEMAMSTETRPQVTVEDLRRELESPEIIGLYKRTYQSILDRVEPDGFFQESVTGAYAGMFPRTVGGLVSLFVQTDELDKARRCVDVVLKAAKSNDMSRCPHVLDRRQTENRPVPGTEPLMSIKHPIALYRLDRGYRGGQAFTAPAKPIIAIDAWLSSDHKGDGKIVCTISESLHDTKGVASSELPKSAASEGGRWVSFKFSRPVQLTVGRRYYIHLANTGDAHVIWFGDVDPSSPLAGGFGHDPSPEQWLDHKDHVTAFAVDTGDLRRKRVSEYPILSRADQLDGNFHVLAGWAMVVLNSDVRKWEDETYPEIARLTDTAVDWPYHPPQAERIWPGLMHNFCLEHSREGRYWDTWDLLTQSWACQGLRMLTKVAERRGDREHADRWRRTYQDVEKAVREKLTMQVDGKLVYAEMRLTNGGDGKLFDGLSWVNLSPVQAQWEGADPEILRNTVYTLRDKTRIHWQGHTAYGDEWTPGIGISQQVIGKGVGWDIAYAVQEKDYASIVAWLDFIKAANNAPLYAEAFNLIDGKMVLQDPGNGEQISWWCWGIAQARRLAGLSPAPEKTAVSR